MQRGCSVSRAAGRWKGGGGAGKSRRKRDIAGTRSYYKAVIFLLPAIISYIFLATGHYILYRYIYVPSPCCCDPVLFSSVLIVHCCVTTYKCLPLRLPTNLRGPPPRALPPRADPPRQRDSARRPSGTQRRARAALRGRGRPAWNLRRPRSRRNSEQSRSRPHVFAVLTARWRSATASPAPSGISKWAINTSFLPLMPSFGFVDSSGRSILP